MSLLLLALGAAVAAVGAAAATYAASRESDGKVAELNAMEKSWRRHFTESDPPDEGQGPQALVQRVRAISAATLQSTRLSVQYHIIFTIQASY